MTEGQTLYATVVVLYLLECAVYVPAGSVAFIGRAVDRARMTFPLRSFRNSRGGLVMAWPFWTNGMAFVVPQWPVSLGREGVLAWVAESLELDDRALHSGAYRSYDDLPRLRDDGREVMIGDEAFFSAASEALARRVVIDIRHLKGLSPDERMNGVVRLLRAQTDVAAVKQRIAAFHEATRSLRKASTALGAIVFFIVPAIAMVYGLGATWPFLLGLVYLATWITAGLFVGAHRALLGDARLERIAQTILLALVPISAVRAPANIARHALHGFHPLAVALVLCEKDEAARFAAHLLRDLAEPRRPICINDAPEARAVEAEYREALRARLAVIAKEAGIDVDQATAPPPREEDAGPVYCPRCQSRYGENVESCDDCGGIPLSSG